MHNQRAFLAVFCLSVLSGLSSCEHDGQSVVGSGDEITIAVDEWRPLAASRAALLENDADFKDPSKGGGNFTLYAHVAGTDNTYIGGARVWFFNDPTVNDWVFLSGSYVPIKYYWPTSGALNFFAYMPDKKYDDGKTAYKPKESCVEIGTYTDADGQSFLCNLHENIRLDDVNAGDAPEGAVADSDQQEFIFAYAANKTREDNPVKLHFVHPFAVLNFQLKQSPANITIKSISIEGIYFTGTCKHKTSTDPATLTGGTGSTITWTTAGVTKNFVLTVNKKVPVDLNLNAHIGGPYIFMPQNLANTVKIKVTYTNEKDPDNVLSKENSIIVGGVDRWEAGKKYNYMLDLGSQPDDVSFISVAVAEWNNNEGYEQEIEVQ